LRLETVLFRVAYFFASPSHSVGAVFLFFFPVTGFWGQDWDSFGVALKTKRLSGIQLTTEAQAIWAVVPFNQLGLGLYPG
jgi:hypothetical protein